jgi:hypothetical protein
VACLLGQRRPAGAPPGREQGDGLRAAWSRSLDWILRRRPGAVSRRPVSVLHERTRPAGWHGDGTSHRRSRAALDWHGDVGPQPERRSSRGTAHVHACDGGGRAGDQRQEPLRRCVGPHLRGHESWRVSHRFIVWRREALYLERRARVRLRHCDVSRSARRDMVWDFQRRLAAGSGTRAAGNSLGAAGGRLHQQCPGRRHSAARVRIGRSPASCGHPRAGPEPRRHRFLRTEFRAGRHAAVPVPARGHR